MINVESKVREWGRSLGVVIPKDLVSKEKIRAGDKIKLMIIKDHNSIKKTFGTFKFKKTTEEMLKEADKEAWNE